MKGLQVLEHSAIREQYRLHDPGSHAKTAYASLTLAIHMVEPRYR